MFVVTGLPVAILFCLITMLGWGSWANTQKLAGKEKWNFALYYWDYALGVVLFSGVWALTLGSAGPAGMGALENFRGASPAALWDAFLSGIEFNVANILLVVAIDAAGMSVAFPVGVGLALVIGTVKSYLQEPRGDATLLFAGVAAIVAAMVLSAMAYSKLPRAPGRKWFRGVAFAVVAGALMGFFYPQLMRAISPSFQQTPIQPGLLTPYTALVFFALGLAASNVVVNTAFLKTSGLGYGDYFAGSGRLHSLGLLGGAIWMLALSLNVLASSVAGPAISYALGQGATLVAAIWGVFVWREFRDAPAGVNPLIAAMFAGYVGGLVLIGVATR